MDKQIDPRSPQMGSNRRVWLALALAMTLFARCTPDPNDAETETQRINRWIHGTMTEHYLWYDRMPSGLNPAAFPSPRQLLDSLRYRELDRWSYLTTRQEHEAYYTRGAYVGLGFEVAFDPEGTPWILYVFSQSPLAAHGVGRGWRITAIDGQAPTRGSWAQLMGPAEVGITKTLALVDGQGQTHLVTVSKQEVVKNTVLLDTIFRHGATRVGYVVLQSFVEPTIAELNAVFEGFAAEGVNELIVDLRYNGGGMIGVARHLAGLIGGAETQGKVLAVFAHNAKNSQRDFSLTLDNPPHSLGLSRVVFITTRGSASASELLINGLSPHLATVVVGDTTHGKPTGMYVFEDPRREYVLVPVCLVIRNANGEGDFFEGLPADVKAADDITRPFGDVAEASLNSALRHLGLPVTKSVSTLQPIYIERQGLQAEIGAW